MSTPFPAIGHLYTLPYNDKYRHLIVTYYTIDGDVRVVDSFVRHTITWVALRRAINNLLKLAIDDVRASEEAMKQDIADTIYQESLLLKLILNKEAPNKGDSSNNHRKQGK